MVLSNNDAELFYRLMWPLQFFVNRRLKLIPNSSTIDGYQKLKLEQKLKIRDALYENIGLIDQFVKENPEGFNEEGLGIIRRWKKFVAGEFFMERYLAKHAIFIRNQTVYAVLGLVDPFESLVGRQQLPARVKTVLLPFKGKIIYDGLMQVHPILFGGGISSELKEIYLTAKQNRSIIESIEPETQQTGEKKGRKPDKDWSAKVDALRLDAQKLSASGGTPPIQGAAFNVVKACLEMAHESVHNPDDLEQLWEHARKVERALRKVYTTLKRTMASDE
ncbi:MAG: hypothetical protein MUO52_15055 [Desulfobacterales bacterium]|nr:hypothetical protein [Desulfobacterales bacterium]